LVVPIELAETLVVNILVKSERVKLFLGLLLLLLLLLLTTPLATTEIKQVKCKQDTDYKKIQVSKGGKQVDSTVNI